MTAIDELRMRTRIALRAGCNRRPVIIVYSQGKSGSSAVAATLEQHGYRAVHVHTMVSHEIERRKPDYRGTDVEQGAHLWWAETVIKKRLRKLTRPLRIIVTIREPVARDISAYFQAMVRRQSPLPSNPQDLLNPETLTWFEDEFVTATGLDVYAAPFDSVRGWQRYRTENCDVLIVQQERLMPDAFTEFLGKTIGPVKLQNAAEQKSYYHTYDQFVQSVTLPESVVESIYESRFVQHFYSADQIDQFRMRWRER